MKLWGILCAALLGCAYVQAESLPVNVIDANKIITGLPLSQKTKAESDNGRLKYLWKIGGLDDNYQTSGGFEIIGNNQGDADSATWFCAKHDAAGNYVPTKSAGNLCYQFFIKVISNVTVVPEQVASVLVDTAAAIKPQSAVLSVGAVSIETDGQFFFVRKIGRR